jgi:hypothetical protein
MNLKVKIRDKVRWKVSDQIENKVRCKVRIQTWDKVEVIVRIKVWNLIWRKDLSQVEVCSQVDDQAWNQILRNITERFLNK